MRELPFSFIQFPIYETLKKSWAEMQGSSVTPAQSSVCGSIGGGIAAALTTPFDVIKTRMMLGADCTGTHYTGISDTVKRIYGTNCYPLAMARNNFRRLAAPARRRGRCPARQPACPPLAPLLPTGKCWADLMLVARSSLSHALSVYHAAPYYCTRAHRCLSGAPSTCDGSADVVRHPIPPPLPPPCVIWLHRSYAAEGGICRFYSGLVPRTLWIGLGGCVFFGSYESVKEFLCDVDTL